MEYLEKVEKIREKTGVSYEDAKTALEACEYDVLDALIYLERENMIPQPQCASYSTEEGQQSEEFARTMKNYEKDCKKKSSGDGFRKFWEKCKELFKKGCENSFEVNKDGKNVVTLPVIVLVLGGLCAFWVTVPLLIIGMFCGCTYRFVGFESTNIDINDLCEKATETCQNIRKDIQAKKEEQEAGAAKEVKEEQAGE